MTATVVGDPGSRSRAIALRFGAAKRDAVLWVSPQGGLMCSCFSGTQNAVLLSVSSRSTDCRHIALLRRSIVSSNVPVSRFRQRMRLGVGAVDFASPTQYGNAVVWTALYQTVFSLVSFTGGNVATCIAPGCRRFRGRCGHVRVARPLNSEFRAKADAEALRYPRGAPKDPKDTPAAGERAVFDVSADEDQGVEKLPCDTARHKGDLDEKLISKRVPRNMLPCVGEMQDVAAWARTADLRAMLRNRAEGGVEGDTAHWKLMGQLMESLMRRGLARDVKDVLVENYCGSCGTKRHERHEVVREPANLYTDNPTAPVLHVRDRPCPCCAFREVLLCDGVDLRVLFCDGVEVCVLVL